MYVALPVVSGEGVEPYNRVIITTVVWLRVYQRDLQRMTGDGLWSLALECMKHASGCSEDTPSLPHLRHTFLERMYPAASSASALQYHHNRHFSPCAQAPELQLSPFMISYGLQSCAAAGRTQPPVMFIKRQGVAQPQQSPAPALSDVPFNSSASAVARTRAAMTSPHGCCSDHLV